MRREYRVITFSLTDEQNSIVSANVPIRDYEVFDTDGFGTVTTTTEGNGVNILWMFSGSKEAAS